MFHDRIKPLAFDTTSVSGDSNTKRRHSDLGNRAFVTTGNEVQEGSAVQIASVSVSPVRIRTAWSMPYTKILPSPIFPVFADEMIVSMTLST